MIEIAKEYINYGLSVLPTKNDKSPNCIKWYGVNISLDNFKDSYGIGIKCGKESGGLECLDFDNHFGNAKEILSEFLNIPEIKEIYNKHKFPVQSTTSGGYHLLFRCDFNEGNQKLAQKPLWDEKYKKWKPDAIIETRGEGGYFVAAPTDGYKIIRNNILEINKISKDERKILIDNAKGFNEWSEPKKTEFENKEKPGDYYNLQPEAIEEMKSCLLKHGWKNERTHLWQRPGKNKGISASLGKVAKNVFYVFSSNAYPFEPNSGYLPFQVISLLDHNSNFKEFAGIISKRYNLSTPDTYQNEIKKPVEKIDTNKLDDILNKCFVDVTIEVKQPPIIMEINHNFGSPVSNYKRLITLGNISCFTGKSKAKKGFMKTVILSSLGMNSYDNSYMFKSNLPENKRIIIDIDTEQGDYDAYISAKRIHTLSGSVMENVGTFKLREFKAKERLQLIEYTIEKFKDNIGVIFIDGIADCVHSINSEEEADYILALQMKWTKIYNIHVANILHQNKKDNFATGWLGTQIMKKAELIMAIEKDGNNKKYSKVTCEMIRGVEEFPDFCFYINENSLPVIEPDSKFENDLL